MSSQWGRMMKTKQVNKLWKGRFVSVRDYEVQAAIKKGGLRLFHNEQIMELSVDELKTLKPTGQNHQSKFGGSYQLIDITWKPLTHDPRQESLI